MRELAKARQTPARLHRKVARAARRDAGGLLCSRGLEIRLPGVERHTVPGCCLAAPELRGIEHDRVEPLRVLAEALCVRVCKHVRAEYPFYDAGLAAKIAGQSRAMLGRRRARPYSLARPEARGARRRALGRCPFCERSEEHTSELQSPCNLVCRLLLEKKKKIRSYFFFLKKKKQKIKTT